MILLTKTGETAISEWRKEHRWVELAMMGDVTVRSGVLLQANNNKRIALRIDVDIQGFTRFSVTSRHIWQPL